MLIVISSPAAVAPGNVPRPDVIEALAHARAQGSPVGIVSNHPEPGWFQAAFAGTGIEFYRVPGRQNGQIVKANTDLQQLQPHDAIVLAGSLTDVQMAKNGGAMIVAAGWTNDPDVEKLGVRVDNGLEFQELLGLTAKWHGAWWYCADGPKYRVRALADLSSMYGQTNTQQIFAAKLKDTVKNGGGRLKALLTVASRTLLADGVSGVDSQLWGLYPASGSLNNETDVLSEFSHRLRTITSRVRFAKVGEPLFIRHTASIKRSGGGGGDRTDPSNQIETLYINPVYGEKGRLVGRNVVVLDDCTTYGVSFGVASALLRKAGAASVMGVALGKFGNQTRYYDIEIGTSPFAPIAPGNYHVSPPQMFGGTTNTAAKAALQQLIV